MSEPVRYIDRSHNYYRAQGFTNDYRYAQHENAPFAKLSTPLADCTLGVVTTASTYPRASLEPRKVDSGRLEDGISLYADDLSWDKAATHLDDLNSFFPVASLNTLVEEGVIGALTRHFHCLPTEYSHKATLEHDAPEIHRRLVADGADVALLVPL